MSYHQCLEDVALDVLSRVPNNRRTGSRIAFTSTQCVALARRKGWDGRPPGTLEEAGNAIGVTRERVRQLELKLAS